MTGESTTLPRIPDYTLLRPIGRGSYGEVWLARSVTGVFRVIKIVRRSSFDDERPFLRELQGISRFQAAVSGRPRQLALLHVGRNDDEGYFYYVMEPADDAVTGSAIDPDRYVPLTLKELFSRRGRLPASECVQLALELARGLLVLHGAGLIHRDIKPSNIIFVQGVPKLADVGLVAATQSTLSCVGTPGYVPPEGPGAPTADIFSLGRVLYEISTGLDRMQFPALPNDLRDDPDTRLMGELNAIILRACEWEAPKRHPTVEELIRDLELIQAGKSLAFYEGIRRRLRLITLAGVAALIIVGLITGMLLWRAGVKARANEQTRRALYRSDLAVAQLAKASGDLGRARAALQRQIPAPGETDLRGLEWSILAREVQGEGQPLQPVPDGAAVSKLVADPSGRWLAGALANDQIALWDLRTGRIARIIDNAAVLGGFAPSGELVIDEPQRALRFEHPEHGPTRRIETGQRLGQLLADGTPLIVSPTGDFLVTPLQSNQSPAKGSVNLNNTTSDYGVSAWSMSPDKRRVAVGLLRESGARMERALRCVDTKNNAEIWSRKIANPILWVICSPDNQTFVANVGGLAPTILRFDSPNVRIAINGHSARVNDAAYTRNGEILATAGADQTVKLWQSRSGSLLSTHRGLGRPATAVTWLPDSQHFAAADDSGQIRIFSMNHAPPQNVRAGLFADVHGDFVFSPNNQLIAVTSKTNTIEILSIDGLRTIEAITNAFQPVAFASNGVVLLAFDSNWKLTEINLNSKSRTRQSEVIETDFSVNGWAISQNQKQLAVVGEAGKLAEVDLASLRSITTSLSNAPSIWATGFTPDGSEIWTGDSDGWIRRWQTSTLRPLGSVTRTTGELQAIALSDDSKWMAASLYNDSSVRIWDRQKSRWLRTLVTHRRFVQSLLFTSPCNRLLSGGTDGRVVVWNVPDFEEVASFDVEPSLQPNGDEGVALLRLSQDGTKLGALMEDGRLQLWRSR